jgi:hypothetical protein
MPKAGTNLQARLLQLLGFRRSGRFIDIGPDEGLQHMPPERVEQARGFLAHIRPGHFSGSHFYFFPELGQIIDDLSIKTVTIVRDPRDVCISNVFYIIGTPNHRLHPYYSGMTEDERLMASIHGMTSVQLHGAPPSLDIGSHYRNYEGWADRHTGLVVKFEDLVGSRGGGSDDRQTQAVTAIANHLEIDLPKRKIDFACANAFWPGARTFRKGQIGDWRNHFGPEHLAAFNQVAGEEMKKFGYED